MGKATQPRRVNRYTLEFKLSAVQMSKLRGVQIQDVAQALDIHPFMLSRWRKEAREGRLRGKHRKVVLNRRLVGELRQLYELKQRYALLKEEHVVTTAGEAFDAPGFVRISYATSLDRLREGVTRLIRFARKGV